MKYLLTFLLTFISIFVFSQTYQPDNGDSLKLAVQVNGVMRSIYAIDLQNTISVPTIAKAKSLRPNGKAILVKDTLQGGLFNILPKGNYTVDSGIVFPMTDANYVLVRVFDKGAGLHTRWWGILGGATDNTAGIRNAIAASKGNKLIFDDSVYHIKGELQFKSYSEYVVNNTKIIQDSSVPSGFLRTISMIRDTAATITGRLSIQGTTPGSNNTTDGIWIDSCYRLNIGDIVMDGIRFGVQIGHTTNSRFGNIDGYNMKGFQVVAGNGGSVCTLFGCKDITFGNLYGENVWKAGLYFSLDATNIVNERIYVGDVNFKLDTSNVANAVAFRSAKTVHINSITSEGGIAGIYADLNIDSQYVEDIHVGNLMVRNNLTFSNTSNALHITSEISKRVKRFSIDNLKSYNSVRPGILIKHAEDIYIGNALVDSVAGDRGISLDDVNNITINNLIVKRTTDGIILTDSIQNFKLGNYYFENLNLAGNGIFVNTNLSFLGILTNFKAESITGYNDSLHSHFGYIFNYGTPPASEQLNIGKIKYTNGNGVLWKGKAFSNITGNILWASNFPTANTNTWNYGDIIYNDSSTNQPGQGWRCSAGGAPGTWDRIDKVWTLDEVVISGNTDSSRALVLKGQSMNFENPVGSPTNKGFGFTDNNITRFLMQRDVINGSLKVSGFNRNGTLISTIWTVDSLNNWIGFAGVSSPQKPFHVGHTARFDDSVILFTVASGVTTNPILSLTAGGVIQKVVYPTDALLPFSDVTTNNVSTTKHGFAPKLPNDATKYLDGTGNYSVPPVSGGTVGSNFTDVGILSIQSTDITAIKTIFDHDTVNNAEVYGTTFSSGSAPSISFRPGNTTEKLNISTSGVSINGLGGTNHVLKISSLNGNISSGTLTGAELALNDVTTNNVSSVAHGFAPKLPNDATKYLDGTGLYSTPPYLPITGGTLTGGLSINGLGGSNQVLKISTLNGNISSGTLNGTELQLTDVTTNNVSTSNHGFTPKLPNDATKFFNGTGTYTVPNFLPLTGGTITGNLSINGLGGTNHVLKISSLNGNISSGVLNGSELTLNDVTTNNVSTANHGFAPKLPNDATKFLNGIGTYTTPSSTGINLTTNGNSGASTLTGNTVNIPIYFAGNTGEIFQLSADTLPAFTLSGGCTRTSYNSNSIFYANGDRVIAERGTDTSLLKKIVNGAAYTRFTLDSAQDCNVHRTELTIRALCDNMLSDSTLWIGEAKLIPTTWTIDPTPVIIGQLHGGSTFFTDFNSPPLSLLVYNDSLIAEVAYNTAVDTTVINFHRVVQHFFLGKVPFGRPFSYVAQVKLRAYPKTDGFVRIWIDDKLVLNYSGSFGYIMNDAPFYKVGIYKWLFDQGSGGHVVPGVVSAKIMYYQGDSKYGNGNNTYDDVRPSIAYSELLSHVTPSAMQASGITREIFSSPVKISNTASTTTENTILTVVIPANTLSTKGSFKIPYLISCTNSANNKILRVKLNGTTISQLTVTAVQSARGEAMISNRNSLSSQIGGNSTTASGNSPSGQSTSAVSTFGINTGANVTLTVTLQTANSAESLALEDFEVIAIN
jgi:hypothetical protein